MQLLMAFVKQQVVQHMPTHIWWFSGFLVRTIINALVVPMLLSALSDDVIPNHRSEISIFFAILLLFFLRQVMWWVSIHNAAHLRVLA